MKNVSGRLIALYRNVTASYWFLPGLIILGGLVLGAVLTTVDFLYADEWLERFGTVLGPATPAGARSILSMIGGSMLSVAGITFSVTLAAIVFASGQYGPHVLPQYRRDRLGQVTLGTFLGIFAYCMVPLYIVQTGSDGADGREGYVPALALLMAMVLAIIGIGMLIAFINHMTTMLHVSNVIGDIGSQTVKLMNQALPLERSDKTWNGPPGEADFLTEDGETLLCDQASGYIQTIATQSLLAVAKAEGLTMDLLVRPGDHVTPSMPVARIAPRLPGSQSLTKIRRAFAYGRQRTPDDDPCFTLDQLCTIAFRALSPGINDPFTATDVIHQLTAIADRAARGHELDAYLEDEDGTRRIRIDVLSFDDVVRLSLERIAPNAAENATVAPVLAAAYDTLLTTIEDPQKRQRVRQAAQRFSKLCEESLPTEEAKADAAQAIERALRPQGDDRDEGLHLYRMREAPRRRGV